MFKFASMVVFAAVVLIPVQAAENVPHKPGHVAQSKQEHPSPQETRVLVTFSENTRFHFLETMRQHLSDISDIQKAMAESNFEAAAKIAEFSMGLGGIKTHNMIAPHMPVEMANLGMEFHKASSQLALSLTQKKKDMTKILTDLSGVTQVCVMCHSMYRVK